MNPIDELRAEIDQLKVQMADHTHGLRQILENKLEGADGAAGTVVALEGGNTSITVLLGKDQGA